MSIVSFLGWVGLVLVVFGALGSMLSGGGLHPLILGHLVLGVVLLLIGLVAKLSRGGGRTLQQPKAFDRRGSLRSVAALLAFLVVVVVLNVVAHRYDQRWDVSAERVRSLASQSQEVLDALAAPVEIVAVVSGRSADEREGVQKLLELYRDSRPGFVEVRTVNAQTEPHLLEQYGFVGTNQKTRLRITLKQEPERQHFSVEGIDEQSITSSIARLNSGEIRKLYYVIGHGEPDLDDSAARGLRDLKELLHVQGSAIVPIVLAEYSQVPEDAALVMLFSPKQKLPEQEFATLRSYLDRGGSLWLSSDPRDSGDVRKLSAFLGVLVGENVVIDRLQRVQGAASFGAQPLVRDFARHPITASLTRQHVVMFNLARSVAASKLGLPGRPCTPLLQSSSDAWGETALERLFETDAPQASRDTDDLVGPLPLAVVCQYEDESAVSPMRRGRVVIVGDTDWVQNGLLGMFSNQQLALQMVRWLTQGEAANSLPTRSFRPVKVPLLEEEFLFLVVATFIVPEALVLFGLFYWWRRRAL